MTSTIENIKSLFRKHSNVLKIKEQLKNNNIQARGVTGSSLSFIISALASFDKKILLILEDKEKAAYVFNDLENLIKEDVSYFPSSYKRSVIHRQEDAANVILRTEVLNKISQNQIKVVVTFPEAIIEKVPTEEYIHTLTLKLKKDEKISIDFIQEVLQEYQFRLVDFVYEPGQYSIRGSIVDIFSFSHDDPFRIDFFGDQVESIRSFDINNQLSKNHFSSISILPNTNKPDNNDAENLLDYVGDGFSIWFEDLANLSKRLEEINEKVSQQEDYSDDLANLLTTDDLKEYIDRNYCIDLSQTTCLKDPEIIVFKSEPQPPFRKNFELLAGSIKENLQKGYETYILSENKIQFDRLDSIFEEIMPGINYNSIVSGIHEGFIDHHLRICLYTDHQIFDRFHKFKLRGEKIKKQSTNLQEINNLNPGDFVVHVDHGIGKFAGLEKIDINGKIQESIKLVYKDMDVLYVNIHSLHKISKYKSKDNTTPKIYKLGSGAWQNLKRKTKNKVKDIARDLIQLYAKRKEEKGFSFSQDTYLQNELESSFIYEDTPDQLSATQLVKKDMEESIPMDRLVCGDVGFGKTEIAIRAAFKAVTDSKQVAVLVPTTILALQHFRTFTERLRNFPCNIDYISRLRSRKDQQEIIRKIKSGEIDIIIGTHKLVGKEIVFKDLGLLVIDEEQKFGVTVKEKLKQLKINVDTLTLTATPIPRTLQFSLMGARDLSIMNTPPPNRYPIITELHTFNEEIISEAIEYEFQRNGQVFFIHNRIQNIQEVQKLINRILPEVRTVIAHGQMEGNKLEKIMLDFIDYQYDVLIATTIIESGLDIPNTNTIIINHAQNFGLSDLHQLRGRVGRTNKKAFCYLLAPHLVSLTKEARRRLKALEEFSELGSGFNIALQDLDIRGAGNLLGAEQSGFIADIGFETYQRILAEAMLELRDGEFKELFKKGEDDKTEIDAKIKWINDCSVDTDLEILFPDQYIENISERIRLYKRLDSLEDENELTQFYTELEDRFGKLPKQSEDLFEVVKMRWKAVKLGFEKIVLKNNTLILHFVNDQESAYYKSMAFESIIKLLQKDSMGLVLKEKRSKLTLLKKNVTQIKEAHCIIKTIHNSVLNNS